MCWTTKFKSCAEMRTAEEDIEVFKIAIDNRERIVSYFYYKEYNVGKTYKMDFNEKPFFVSASKLFNIDSGFHSYSTKCRINLNVYDNGYILDIIFYGTLLQSYSHVGLVKLNCIIPKGSHYYENEYGEIVSDSLKIVSVDDIVKNYNLEQRIKKISDIFGRLSLEEKMELIMKSPELKEMYDICTKDSSKTLTGVNYGNV